MFGDLDDTFEGVYTAATFLREFCDLGGDLDVDVVMNDVLDLELSDVCEVYCVYFM